MRRILASLLVVFLFVFLAATWKPAARADDQPRFQPAEVTATADATYPANTVIGGTVVLQVTVDESGAIADVRAVRSVVPFTDEAIRSVKKWKFRAAQLDGEPVESAVTVAFTFVPPVLQVTTPAPPQ